MKRIISVIMMVFIFSSLFACSSTPKNSVFSVSDLTGKKIGVLSSSAAVRYAEKYGTVQAYEASETMLSDLKLGVIDCIITDTAVAEKLVPKLSSLKLLEEPLANDGFYFAIARENADLKKAVNSALRTLRESGELQQMADGYIHDTDYRYTFSEDAEYTSTLTLAVGDDFPPFKYKDADGNFCGLEIDVARAVCQILEVELSIQEAKTEELASLVLHGDVPFALSGFTGLEEGAEQLDFSDAYFFSNQSIIVRKR